MEEVEVWVGKLKEDELGPVPGIKGSFERFINPSKPNQHLVCALGRLDPGEDMGWHSHPEEEAFIIISGRGLVRWKVNDQIHEAEVGYLDAFYKEGNVPHQMVNNYSEPLLGIAVKVEVNG